MTRALVVMACIAGTGCLWTDEGTGSGGAAPGCGDGMVELLHESCDDGNTKSGDGCSSTCLTETAVTVHWKIQNSAGEQQACPAGFDTVEVTRLALRASGTPMPFRCEDGQAHLEWLEGPRNPAFGLQLRIVSSTSHEVFGETVASFHSEGVPLDVTGTLITDIGRLHLYWTLSRGGVMSTCDALGVSRIKIALVSTAGGTVTLEGTCSSNPTGDYPTGDLPTGTYRVEMSASSANGPGFGARDGVAVPTGGLLANVPPIEIVFSP
jgi:cysteine-rich repeat protein